MRSVLTVVVALGAAGAVVTAGAYELHEGTYSPMSFAGTFIQWGGTALVNTITYPYNITIHQGAFYSGKIDLSKLNGYAFFTQNGGRHVNSNGITLASSGERFVNRGSSYTMNGGVLKTPYFGSGGSYAQSGGRTMAGQFTAIPGGSARVEDGTLSATNLTVSGLVSYYYPGGTAYSKARFEQLGGKIVVGRLGVGDGGDLRVEGGVLSASNLTVSGVARYLYSGYPGGTGYVQTLFTQLDGKIVAGDFVASAGASARVEGGTLSASNLTVTGVGPYRYPWYAGGGIGYVSTSFDQFGGTVLVDRRLAVDGQYSLGAGSLTADTIMVAGYIAIGSSDIVNTQRFILKGGRLSARASCRLGRLALRTNGMAHTVSELIFDGPAVVQFRNSSMVPWTPGAYLGVRNWRGLPNGGGENQFRVGYSTAGLSREQLARIIFENPANLPLGDYSARMLSTGEVVPNTPIGIRMSRGSDRMVLAWREPYYLETTTNLASLSQWIAVTQASPLTIQFSQPQRYFRLRRY